jgi:alpha-L-rhamnosidase
MRGQIRMSKRFVCTIRYCAPMLLALAAWAGPARSEAPAAARPNLAAGKPVKVFSSIEGNGWGAALLTDGQKGGAGWSGKAFAAVPDHSLYPEFAVVDLGTNHNVDRVDLYPRGDGAHAGEGFPEDFTIQLCEEGESWVAVVTERGHPQPKDGTARTFSFPPRRSRFVKIEATRLRPAGASHHCQLAELEVFGRPADVPPPAPVAPPPPRTPGAANLRCEYRVDPIGIDEAKPRLSWIMEGNARGQKQTAYRVLVAADRADLDAEKGTSWDSGRIGSAQSIAVAYAGKPLKSGGEYFWKVMLWDKDGKPTSWSPPARFVMGKLQPSDWKGQWVGASEDPKHQAVYLRKDVDIPKAARRATAFFCGLGWSELSIDGKKVSDWVLSPGNTCYHIRTQYLAFDVTDRFTAPGRKALGVILADGWYALEKDPWVHRFEKLPYVDKPKLLLDIELEFADGGTQTLCSDESWKWSFGPITRNWVGVEDIDLRMSMPGWDKSGYADSAWRPVAKVPGPAGKWVVQKEPPTRVLQTVKPQILSQNPKTGAWIFEFGREFQGWPRFRTSGPAGTIVTIIVHPTSRHTQAGSRFVLAGQGVEEYSPRFHYNAVSRVEIRGAARPPALDDLTGCLVAADLAEAGRFRCSDDTINWLNESVRRTQINYIIGVPNDPTREKKGWTQDIETMLESSAYLLDSQALYARWFWDIHDGQRPDGNCPNVTPGPFYDSYNSPWWGGCMVWGPWHWYLYYGDPRILADHYEAMKKYVDFLGKSAEKSGGLQTWGLADWLDVVKTPNAIVNTPAHFLFAQIVSRSAGILGRLDDAVHYAKVADGVRDAYNAKFLDRAGGRYAWPDPKTKAPVSSQAAQAMALGVGLAPPEVREAVGRALLADIAARNGFLSTGFVSVPYLLDVLADLDPQAGHEMTTKRPAPSWYAMTAGTDHDIQKETWSGGQALMPSLGGSIAKWHVRALAGIWPDESGPGFKKVLIKPNVVGNLHWVNCHFDSVHGRIASRWHRQGRRLTLEVTIPANTTATIHVPTNDPETVTEGGRPAAQAEGLRLIEKRAGAAVFATEGGQYRFESAWGGK